MKRTLLRMLLLASAVAASATFVACSGPGGDDDDDDGTINPTHCQVLWSNVGQFQQRYDVYVVDMPIEEWVTQGTEERTYTLDVGSERVAVFYDELDFATDQYDSRAITTAGTFSIAVASTSTGTPVQLDDPGAQQFFEVDGQANTGMFVGSGGIATFTGVWSDPDPAEPPDAGQGSVLLTYHGTALEIGVDFVNFAVCYDEDETFAPPTALQRIEQQLRRFHP